MAARSHHPKTREGGASGRPGRGAGARGGPGRPRGPLGPSVAHCSSAEVGGCREPSPPNKGGGRPWVPGIGGRCARGARRPWALRSRIVPRTRWEAAGSHHPLTGAWGARGCRRRGPGMGGRGVRGGGRPGGRGEPSPRNRDGGQTRDGGRPGGGRPGRGGKTEQGRGPATPGVHGPPGPFGRGGRPRGAIASKQGPGVALGRPVLLAVAKAEISSQVPLGKTGYGRGKTLQRPWSESAAWLDGKSCATAPGGTTTKKRTSRGKPVRPSVSPSVRPSEGTAGRKIEILHQPAPCARARSAYNAVSGPPRLEIKNSGACMAVPGVSKNVAAAAVVWWCFGFWLVFWFLIGPAAAAVVVVVVVEVIFGCHRCRCCCGSGGGSSFWLPLSSLLLLL